MLLSLGFDSSIRRFILSSRDSETRRRFLEKINKVNDNGDLPCCLYFVKREVVLVEFKIVKRYKLHELKETRNEDFALKSAAILNLMDNLYRELYSTILVFAGADFECAPTKLAKQMMALLRRFGSLKFFFSLPFVKYS